MFGGQNKAADKDFNAGIGGELVRAWWIDAGKMGESGWGGRSGGCGGGRAGLSALQFRS